MNSRFEVVHALNNLGERIPDFFRQELFAHGELKVKLDAIEILKSLNPEQKSARILSELIKLH